MRLVAWTWLAFCAVCLSAAGCALFNFYTLPSVYVPTRPVAKDFPDAGLVILEDVGTLEYRVVNLESGEARLVAVLDHRRKIKILREGGLAAADVSLPMDGFSTITRTVARSVTADGHTSNMSSSAISVEPRTGLYQQAPDVRVMKFHIPDAEIGGLLEYRYERVYTDPLLIDPWIFGDAMPVVRSEFNLITSPEAELDYAYGRGDQIVEVPPKSSKTAEGKDQYTFVERDLPPSFSEPLMPHLAHVVPWIAVVVRAVRGDGGALHLDTWSAVADRVWADLTAIAVRPAEGTVIERYEQVRKGLTPLLLPGLGIHAPVPGDALSQGTPACPRDAVSVLLQSLVGVELEAYPALLTGAMGLPVAESVPGYYPFAHIVAALRVGDKLIADQQCTGDYLKRSSFCGMNPNSLVWLDPLCKDCAFGVLPDAYAGGRALILEPNNPHWITMPLEAPERHAATIHYLWAFDHNGAFNGTVGAELRGTPAQRVRFALREIDGSPDEAAARANIISSTLDRDPGALKIRGGKLLDQNLPSKSFGLQAQVRAESTPRGRGRFHIATRDLVGSSIPDTWRPVRRHPAVTDGPYWRETLAEITLPMDYHVHTGQPVKLSTPFGEYAAGYVFHDGKLRYARRMVLKVHTVSAEAWPAFADFFQQVRDIENDGPILQDTTTLVP